MLVLWSLWANCKQKSSIAVLFTSQFYFSQMDSRHSKPISFHWPTHKGLEAAIEEKMQTGRVFMSLNPWSTFEHRTVNEPLVIFRLVMNAVRNVLSCTEVQRPAKATSIHSLMIQLCCCLLVSRSPTLCFEPQKCHSESICYSFTVDPSAEHALALV